MLVIIPTQIPWTSSHPSFSPQSIVGVGCPGIGSIISLPTIMGIIPNTIKIFLSSNLGMYNYQMCQIFLILHFTQWTNHSKQNNRESATAHDDKTHPCDSSLWCPCPEVHGQGGHYSLEQNKAPEKGKVAVNQRQ